MDQLAMWDRPASEPVSGGASTGAAGPRQEGATPLVIDCDLCIARGPACQDCMVTVLLGPTPVCGFAEEEARALQALAEGGLIPPLRMVHSVASPELPLP